MLETEPEIFECSVTLFNGNEPRIVLDAKVIVIEPSDSQARSLETLLRFLDLEPIHVHDLAEFSRAASEAHEMLAVIVGSETVAAHGQALVAHLRAMPLPVPLIYLSGDGLPKIAAT